MGRYTSYGIATSYIIPLKDLENSIKNDLWGKSIDDFHYEDLYSLFPEDVYEIHQLEKYVIVLLKDCYNGTEIYSLLKDFSTITPYKRQLSAKVVEEIGQIIKDKPFKYVMELAEKGEYEAFQAIDIPYYLYWTRIPIGDKCVYSHTMVKGILIGYSYDKTITEDDTEPYAFLTSLLRYRLKENPLAPTLLAYLSV